MALHNICSFSKATAVWALGLAILTAISPAAFAAPELIYYGICGATANPDSSLCLEQRGTAIDPTVASAVASAYASDDGFNGSANASASYSFSVDYGQLGTGALANAVANSPIVNPSGYSNGASAFSTAIIGFVDEITPYSTTLDSGSLVMVNFGIPIHGVISSTLFPGGNVSFYYNVSWQMGEVHGEYLGAGSGSVDEFNSTEFGSFMARVGELSQVVVGITLSVAAEDFPYISSDMWHTSSADINANFQNTVKLFLEAVDPNVTLVSASGHDYAPAISSVPEPATFAMVLPGLVGLIWYRRRLAK